jgi:hypothetical protein
LVAKESTLEIEIQAIEARKPSGGTADDQVAAALAILERLPQLAADDTNMSAIADTFRLVNVQLFLKFQAMQVKNRILNKIAGGILTFGATPAPIPLYAGPTAHIQIKGESAATVAAGSVESVSRPSPYFPGEVGNSLGNVSRGDRI